MYDVDLQNNLMIIREFENPEKLYLETLLVSKQKYTALLNLVFNTNYTNILVYESD